MVEKDIGILEKNFIEDLKKQIKFLKNSCALYDQGDEDEAIRIATTLRILLHNTNQSKSLFRRLKIENLFSTAPNVKIAPGAYGVIGLVCLRTTFNQNGIEGHCIPSFANKKNNGISLSKGNPKNINSLVSDWWEQEIIFYWKEMLMTRKKLFLVPTNH